MQMKPAAPVEPDNAATHTAVKRLLCEMSTDELEPLAIEIIEAHRRRLERAHELFEVLESSGGRTSATGCAQQRHDYRVAMLNLHAQHQLVSLVVEALGYVPDVDALRPLTNKPN